jgi:DNA polymerase gamma 1
MTCLTPSHEEKITEGASCTLLDTVDALTITANINKEEDCLLGEARETSAANIEQETIQQLLEKVKMNFIECDLPFLKAQMYKNYKSHVDPSLSGGRETERVVKFKRISNRS